MLGSLLSELIAPLPSNLLFEDFTPTSIADLKLWLDASDGSTITHSSGAVSQWDDKSGSGNNATQGTASAQPTTGSVTVKGRNALSFDGGDVLLISDGTDFDHNTTGFTMLCAARRAATASGFQQVFSKWNGGSDLREYTYGTFQVSGTQSVLYSTDGTAGTLGQLNNVVWAANSTIIGGIVYDPGVKFDLLNGSATPAQSGGAITLFSGGQDANVGGSANAGSWNQIICEILYYQRDLTIEEVNLVGNYLNEKWGGAWS